MSGFEQYTIPFSGLALGNHHFDFQVGTKFFEAFEYSEIHGGDLNIKVLMEKQERMLILHFDISGMLSVPCDRCLDPLNLEVSGSETLYIKFGDTYQEESAEVIVIPRTEHRIDLKQYLYEYILLTLPYRRVHPDDTDGNSTCNPDILRKLESLKPQEPADPRWEALKGLKNEEN